jgi:hypothetical protein
MVPRNPRKQQRHVLLAADFDIQMHYSVATASLLIHSHTLQLLFISKSKIGSKGHHFESTDDIQRAVMQALNYIPQTAFQE